MLTPRDRARQLCLPVFDKTVARAFDLAAGSAVLSRLVDTSADTLHCADEFDYGVQVRGKGHAFSKRNIQVNTPWETRYLVVDRDVDYGIHSMPVLPSIAVLNESNGHSHLFYELLRPVLTGDKVRAKPQQYMDSVRRKLTAACAGDPCYTGHMAKNPLHSDWRVMRTGRAYTLNYLADALRGVKPIEKPSLSMDYGGGRNCTLFDTVRQWAYGHVNDYGGLEAWKGAVLLQCSQTNLAMFYNNALPAQEVAHTARSIAGWTWKNRGRLNRHYKPRGILNLDKNLPLVERQRLAAEHANNVRRKATEQRLWDAVDWVREQGDKLTVSVLARQAGLSRQALYQHYDELLPELFQAVKVSTTVSIR